MLNIYDTLNKTNMIRTKYMNHIKDMEQIDKRICEIINIINICIIHNASEHLLKQNIDTYTKHKEQIQKQELNKIIKKLQNKINNGDNKNFYETIRRLQINNNIQIQDNIGIVIHQNKDKAITIGKYFQQLFKHKYHMNIQWENEINTKTQ
ncbi:hypothetical protein RFI_29390 [Reticulomyxa filosa]|uniref:Uncharacterized protein n=1 Tax=Reticulomyxa filosa TaxID=46433 RepID=X6M2Z7_RETFI|nr:hypothetical protein RFI_29390 [Reticulomyxa filosa]|eukprot:ETO08001.1 hypothetical protein RFI_29390 [Reticulomyxa filosa]